MTSSRGQLDTRVYLREVEKPSTVVDRQQVNIIVSNPVDDTIAAHDNFSKVLDSQLWNNSTHTGIIDQSIGSAENSVSECGRYLPSIPSNE